MQGVALRCLSLVLLIPAVSLFPAPVAAAGYKAGVARVVITPEPGLWMAGYAARTKPAEGKVHDLWAKAVALEDEKGTRLVLLTTDLLGLPRPLSLDVATAIEKQTKLPRSQLMLTSSHTHCGPVLRGNLMDMYDINDEQRAKLTAYRDQLKQKLIQVVLDALGQLQPATLSIGQGTARFAINRRQPVPQGVNLGTNPQGPVDHTVPVLRVAAADGATKAVVFGYACHNTTLDFYQWSGDYAGYAQEYFEESHPNVVAMFWSGCGGDANPHPRRTLENCQQHGKELATAVTETLKGGLEEIKGSFSAAYQEIPIRFASLPAQEHWQNELMSKNFAQRTRAARFLQILELGGKIPDQYDHYPVQCWRVGDKLEWVALGGEVVVDYLLALRKLAAPERTVWVTAYANDVMCYVPSVRILREGGYEGDSSMIYYGMPTKWHEEIEEKILGQVKEQWSRPDRPATPAGK